MTSRHALLAGAVAGALLMYCGQTMAPPDAQMIRDARGQTDGPIAGSCCIPPAPRFDKLAEGELRFGVAGNANQTKSDTVTVSAYREVVVYVRKTLDTLQGTCPRKITVNFSASGSSTMGATGQDVSNGARVRVDGTDLQLELGDPFETYKGCGITFSYVVAGVQGG